MNTLGVSCLLAAAALALGQASAQESPERGQRVFNDWCAPCHGTGPGKSGTVALEFRYQGSKPAALEARTDLTLDLTKYFVRNGISIMSPFRKTEISDADLEAVAAYLAPREE